MSQPAESLRAKGALAVYRRVLSLIAAERRPRFAIVVFAMIAMAAFDLIGVAAILPFLAVLSDPTSTQSGLAGLLYEALGFRNSGDFLIFLGVLVFALIMASVIVRAFVFYLMTRFIRGTTQQLALDLLSRYLARPYEWYLGKNSAEIGKNLLAEALLVVDNAIAPSIRLIANVAVTLALLGLLVAVEPFVVAVSAGFILLTLGLIYGWLGPLLDRAGDRRLKAGEDRFRITNEAMGGIKEVKLRGLEAAFVERFRGPSLRIAQSQARISLISNIPHYLIEALCFGGMIAFVLFLLFRGGGAIDAVLPVIGLFAFAGIKLIPIAKEIYADASLLRANTPVLESLRADLDGPDARDLPADIEPLGLKKAIALEDITYSYPGAAKQTFDRISLAIPAGARIGIVGSTGAGKTTLVDILLGLLSPDSGAITIDGTLIDETNRRAWQRTIGYVPQSVYLSDTTIAANIAYGEPAGHIDLEKVAQAGKLAALHDFVMTIPDGYLTEIGEGGVRLSGGQRQRIGIARALYRDPDLLVLDEATSALDTVTERAVIDAIERPGSSKTLIIITHRLSTVKNCDEIVMLEHGRIAARGTFAELSGGSREFGALLDAG